MPLRRKFMNFSFQNGVIWCILGVLFLRFICPMDCSCMVNFIEVPVCTYRTIGLYRLANPCLHKLQFPVANGALFVQKLGLWLELVGLVSGCWDIGV